MNKIIKRVISLLVGTALLSMCFGCSANVTSSKKTDVLSNPVYPQATDMSAHYCNTVNLKEIDASGLITLLFDENSTSVAVRITNSQESKLWSALPQTVEGLTVTDEADILALEVIHDGKRYLMNSQDNCVTFGGAYWNETEEGFEVTYLVTDNGDWLDSIDLGATDEAYRSAAKGNILYKCVATYSLKDGCFYADLDWENLGDDEDILVNIGFLEYFGADETAQQGDYILVPDGSGALIDTASAEEVAPVDIAVYGSDIADSVQQSSVVAAYGMKSGNDAFAAVIEKGDAVAGITANKARNDSSFNRVGPNFTVTLSEIDGEAVYYSDFSYEGGVSLCFRFLSGSNATYSGMAAACREQLIRDYTLSTRSVDVTEYMPVLVNVIGSAKPEGFLKSNKKLTVFTEAKDILGRIKSKGINNVYLRYSGALTGGLNERNAAEASMLDLLGGSSGADELNSYASSLNFKVFYDVALISDTKSDSSSMRKLSGDRFTVNFSDPFTLAGFTADTDERYINSVSELEGTVLTVLKKFDLTDYSGYCITDVGSFICTDTVSRLDRQSVASAVAKEIAPLSTSSPVMINGGNFYSLKNADVISALPMTCTRTQTDSYTAVPFVQIILHGIVEFVYDGINTAQDPKTALLKCVEFGALPGYVLTNNVFSDEEKYSEIFSVDSWLNTIYDSYSSISETLNDLRGSRITDHYLVSSGVWCTEYESTTRIYVNYTDEAVTVSGITVEPMSFFRVN